MSAAWYNAGRNWLATGGDWTSADVRVLLLDNAGVAYTFDADHDDVADVVASEIASTVANYARKVLANKAATVDDVNDRVNLTADDVTWTLLGACAVKAVVVYVHAAADANATLLCYLDGTGYPSTHAGSADWLAEFTGGVVARVA